MAPPLRQTTPPFFYVNNRRRNYGPVMKLYYYSQNLLQNLHKTKLKKYIKNDYFLKGIFKALRCSGAEIWRFLGFLTSYLAL